MKSVLELSCKLLTQAASLVAVLAAASAMLGCTQANLYQASHLPPEFLAPRYSVLQDVDLSRLARTVGNSQVLYVGDHVAVTIATGLEKNTPTAWQGRVAEDGAINVPLVGAVQVVGLELTRAEQAVRSESIRRGKFVNPTVSIVFEKRKMNSIAVVGAIENPKTYELPSSRSDLLTAIVEAGGLSKDAGTIIEIRYPPGFAEAPVADNGQSVELAGFRGRRRMIRTPPRTVQVDLTQAANSDVGDYLLPDGATVMVMKRPPRFFQVIGLVEKPDRYEFPDDQPEMRLLDALAMAGGRTFSIADKIHVLRQVPGRTEPVVIQMSVRDAKRNAVSNIRLASGDVVSVEETPSTFVVGIFRDFIRFGFSSTVPGI